MKSASTHHHLTCRIIAKRKALCNFWFLNSAPHNQGEWSVFVPLVLSGADAGCGSAFQNSNRQIRKTNGAAMMEKAISRFRVLTVMFAADWQKARRRQSFRC